MKNAVNLNFLTKNIENTKVLTDFNINLEMNFIGICEKILNFLNKTFDFWVQNYQNLSKFDDFLNKKHWKSQFSHWKYKKFSILDCFSLVLHNETILRHSKKSETIPSSSHRKRHKTRRAIMSQRCSSKVVQKSTFTSLWWRWWGYVVFKWTLTKTENFRR